MSKQAPSPARWPVDIMSVGSASVGAQVWRYRGQLNVTILAKAMFAIVPSGTATLAPPEDVLRHPVHATANPASPLLYERDLAPYLPNAEIVFTGHAHAPHQTPVTRMHVRLALLRGETALVDKRLEVVGDRVTNPKSPPAASVEPKPFLRMPIVYQRAWGGLGESNNPYGTGLGSNSGRMQLPNIIALDGSQTPVTLGPVPAFYPARERLLRGTKPPELSAIPSLPDDFDGSYFHQAPEDQRFDALRGGERLVLEGLDPTHAHLETWLPALRGLAMLHLPNGVQRWILLVPNSLVVKGDASVFAVVCRGHFQVAHADALAGLRFAAGVEVDGAPMPWPDLQTILARPTMSAPLDEPTQNLEEIDWNTTLTLDECEIEVPASVSSSKVALSPEVGLGRANEKVVPAERTVVFNVRELQDPNYMPVDVTLAGARTPSSVRAPFPIARAGTQVSEERGDIPGAPWATSRPVNIEEAQRPDSMFKKTLEVPPMEKPQVVIIAPIAPSQAIEPAASAPPAPAKPSPPAKIWAEQPAPPVAPTTPAPAPVPAPRIGAAKPELAKSMYSRFRKS